MVTIELPEETAAALERNAAAAGLNVADYLAALARPRTDGDASLQEPPDSGSHAFDADFDRSLDAVLAATPTSHSVVGAVLRREDFYEDA